MCLKLTSLNIILGNIWWNIMTYKSYSIKVSAWLQTQSSLIISKNFSSNEADANNNNNNGYYCSEAEIRKICFSAHSSSSSHILGDFLGPNSHNYCNFLNITYRILDPGTSVKLIPPSIASHQWRFSIDFSKKFENNDFIATNLSCSIQTNRFLFYNFTQLIQINVKCSTPRPQQVFKLIPLKSSKIKKGDVFDNFLFLDELPLEEKSYKVFIRNSNVNNSNEIFQKNCTYYFHRNLENSTIIHCFLIAKRTLTIKKEINFSLGLKNFNPECKSEVYHSGFINVTLRYTNRRPKRSNLIFNNSKIFRNAALFARVTQPQIHRNDKKNYQCRSTNSKENPLNITSDGIIYVGNVKALENAPEDLQLNITWMVNNSNQLYYEEVNVRIVDQPTQICTNNSNNPENYLICSMYKTKNKCMSKEICGLGSGGATNLLHRSSSHNNPYNCMWRGDPNPDNIETHLFSTCSPDTKYCPDGECDSLEKMHFLLCPQDCTDKAVFPAKLKADGQGVDKCNGIVACDDMGCTCHYLKQISGKKLNKNLKNFFCGKDCVLLIAGGSGLTVFIATFFLLLWRIIKKKNYEEKYMLESLQHQEAEIPFSDYVDRSVAREPIILNFHMNSSLEENSSNKPLMKEINVKIEEKWKFPMDQIIIEQVLGEGEFGRVLKAKAFNISGKPGYSLVAVKTLKENAAQQDFHDLYSEYNLLKEVNHPHVIQLLGVCSSCSHINNKEADEFYMIIEYAKYGSLRNYLRKSRHILITELIEENLIYTVTPKDILSFARQIASGMSYLSDIKLVHRDLAARNILLAENKVCKISDFGLTRDIYEDNAYFKKSRGRVPVKWMAPESLADHIYTTKSDIWSFGILIWELVTLGATPYPGIQAQDLYNLLKHGFRMDKPPNCSNLLYSVMTKCWNIDPELRPTFLELYHTFDTLLIDNVNYLDLSDNSIINKSYFANLFREDKINDDKEGANSLMEEKMKIRKELEKNDMMEKINLHNPLGYETPVIKKFTPININGYTIMNSQLI